MTNPTNQTPLGGFEQRLLGELRQLVEQRADEQAIRNDHGPITPTRWGWVHGVLPRRGLGRSLAAAGALVGAVCAAVLVALSAGSSPTLAQAFPILTHSPTVIPRAALVSLLQSSGAGSSAARLAVNQARAFETPLGTGYVLTDKQQNLLCIATPGFAHSWGAACGAVRDALNGEGSDLLTYGRANQHQVDVVDIHAQRRDRDHPRARRPDPAATATQRGARSARAHLRSDHDQRRRTRKHDRPAASPGDVSAAETAAAGPGDSGLLTFAQARV